MENNNGRGIFYGVIGVATLVVAMIGATFAYFSAQAASNNNAIAANATTINLNFSEITTGLKYNLIPVDETSTGWNKGGYIGINTADTDADGKPNPKSANCVDDDGNEFCSVYQFTVTNPSTTTAQKVYARFDVSANTFTVNTPDNGSNCDYLTKSGESAVYCNKTNLAYAVFKGTAADVISNNTTNGWDVNSSALVTTTYDPATATGVGVNTTTGNVAGTTVVGALGDLVVARTATVAGDSTRLEALDQTLKPGGTVTYTVVMWLHEPHMDQESDEGKGFTAGITFSTSLEGSGVTAVLGTAG